MTEAMKITLSPQPADARWGEKATYSINNDGITLHLNGADDLGLIQRAARKIDGLGIKHVQLSGEGWDADRCWAKAGMRIAAGHSGKVTKPRKAYVKWSGRIWTMPSVRNWITA